MFCGLEEERTRFGKKKKEKRKNLIATKNWLVGMKGEIFFVVLKLFLNETAFYANPLGRFLGPKTKVTWLIASKFRANMQVINFKLLLKFYVARPNCSGVISKSLKSHTR